MTVDEAKAILFSGEGYEDFGRVNDFVIDGHYTLQQLEAVLVVAREKAQQRS